MQFHFTEMFLMMFSTKICTNGFALPIKRAVRASLTTAQNIISFGKIQVSNTGHFSPLINIIGPACATNTVR